MTTHAIDATGDGRHLWRWILNQTESQRISFLSFDSMFVLCHGDVTIHLHDRQLTQKWSMTSAAPCDAIDKPKSGKGNFSIVGELARWGRHKGPTRFPVAFSCSDSCLLRKDTSHLGKMQTTYGERKHFFIGGSTMLKCFYC